MVSADNLPYDVLPLIFHHLSSGTDLVSVSLVSKSFSGGVLPILYETVNIRIDVAKRLGVVTSPFHTLLKNVHLQLFVRNISIHSIPLERARPSPAFMLDLCKLLPKLTNLASFSYTVPTLMALLPPMLPGLVACGNLKELKIMGEHVGNVQAEMLTKVGKSGSMEGIEHVNQETAYSSQSPHGLGKLWLKNPSPSIMQRLDKWIEGNKHTLKSLSILDAPSLSTEFLRLLVTHVPHLTSLTLTQCPDIDHWKVLGMLEHLSDLKSLCLNVMSHSTPPNPSPISTSLKHLRCLFLISQSFNSIPKLQATFTGILAPFQEAGLESITFEAMDSSVLPLTVATAIGEFHGKTLKRLNLLRMVASKDAIQAICERCEILEQLCLDFGPEMKPPAKGLITILASLRKLHTLVDARCLKPHHDHGGQDIRLTAQDVSSIAKIVPSLRKIINANRCWNVSKSAYGTWVSTASRINTTSPPISFIRDS
ncbi:hypothetical protein M408DRAFT_314988 [Serendipita vermifera MAFF 305830]|uniref:F-box domain-containing protein n=1 Tax=Serendipita vermifera MAFF 305830 TaxID=933852 RepID=A0A0C3AMA2_SERVB|nr:hypothetical protein M408DRAFT_314988 [Serendipita vermifera MAFF 305830]